MSDGNDRDDRWLQQMLRSLEQRVETGFQSTHTRLDEMNNRVRRNEREIWKLKAIWSGGIAMMGAAAHTVWERLIR